MNEVQDVLRLHQAGQISLALSKVAGLTRRYPRDPHFAQLQGVLLCQSGDLAGGIDALGRSVALAPDNLDARFNLGKALLDAGRPEEAERICAPAAARSADIRQLIAAAHKAQGRVAEAITALKAIVAEKPRDSAAWNNLGSAMLETGDAAGALDSFDRALALGGPVGALQVNRARAMAELDRPDESLAAARAATEADPGRASAWLELGLALNRVDQSPAALQALGTAARLDRANAEILLAIGLTMASLAQFDEAEQAYRFAIDVDPSKLGAYLNLGILLEQGNRPDELDTLIKQAKTNGAAGPEINFLDALTLRRQGEFAAALELANGARSDAVAETLRCHLVGQLADRLGDAPRAFAAFAEMNRATAADPSARGFDGTEHRRWVEQANAATTPQEYATWPVIDLPDDPPAPTFLVGFPRSGTTLLDTILMGHPGTLVLEEVPLVLGVSNLINEGTLMGALTEDEVRALHAEYFARLEVASPGWRGKHVIDKMPFNMLRAPLIHRLFPQARFLFALRHPCDAVLSCFMQSFRINQAMASFLDLTNAALLYDRAMTYWMYCRDVFGLQVHTVRYEDLVADLNGQVRSAIDFLGLPWDDQLLAYRDTASERTMIRTPSYAQVTEQIYTRARGRWERYRAEMREVLPILEPWAIRFGYGPLGDGPALADG